MRKCSSRYLAQRWLFTSLVIFCTVWIAYHVYLSYFPRKLLVIVDASHSMHSDWNNVLAILERLKKSERYTQFSLYTEKQQVHTWSQQLKLGSILPYAPRNITRINEIYQKYHSTTDNVILITNLPATELDSSKNWTVIRSTTP